MDANTDHNARGTLAPHHLWLIYFPRACHHLFMRMFSEQPHLDIIEVLTHTHESVEPTVELAAKGDLDAQDVKAECDSLRDLMQAGFDSWMQDLDRRSSQGQRVLSSCSVAFQGVSPGVEHAWLNERLHRTKKALPNGQAPQHNEKPDHTADESAYLPSSPDYWLLRNPDNHTSVLSGLANRDSDLQNPTPYPDPWLRTQTPILLIRSPLRAFPSVIRAASQYFDTDVDEAFLNFVLRYSWHRMIYSYYASDSTLPNPLVLDADDLMYNSSAVKELCHRTGLEFGRVKYEWSSAAKIETTYAREDLFTDTLAASTGVVEGKGSKGVKLDVEYANWVVEFGEKRAYLLKGLVEDEMTDYNWLWERRITGR